MPSPATADLGFDGILSGRGENVSRALHRPAGSDLALLDVVVGAVEPLPDHGRGAVGGDGHLRRRRVLPGPREGLVLSSGVPAAVIRRAWTTKLVPSERTQVTTAMPPLVTATCGASASCPAAESWRIVPSVPLGAMRRVKTEKAPLLRALQTTVEAPSRATATSGPLAISAAGERSAP